MATIWTTLHPGIQRLELLPAHAEHRPPPLNLAPEDEPLFAHEYDRHWGPCQVTALDRLDVLGASWVQWGCGRLVDHYRPGHGATRRKRGRLKDLAQLRQPCQRVNEALWVHDDWSGNYFHWLTDVLPKLQAWLEAGLPCRSVLVPHALLQHSYVHDSLRWLGFEPIAWHGTRLWIERLIVINATAPTGNFRAALLRRLGQHLRQSSAAAAAHEGTPKKMYISRADAARRFLRNEAELMATLATHQLQVVQLEGRSLAEQVALFSRCRLLVGLHGAGLTNMLWMPTGSTIMEIRREGDQIGNCYYAMANALGHNYLYIVAKEATRLNNTHECILDVYPCRLSALLAKHHKLKQLNASLTKDNE